MKPFRVSLRLMLLLVALCAVLFAWVGAQRELRRTEIRAKLNDLQHNREYFVVSRQHFVSESAWHSTMDEVEAEIVKVQRELDSWTE